MRIRALALTLFVPVLALTAQVPENSIVVSLRSQSSQGLIGGLAVVDPANGNVAPVVTPLPVILDFAAVVVEPGVSNLFAARSTPMGYSVVHYQLTDLSVSGQRQVFATTMPTFVDMVLGPLGRLWVLLADATQRSGELWNVDPRSVAAPVLVRGFTAQVPTALATDATELFCAIEGNAGVELLRIDTLGASTLIPRTMPLPAISDLAYSRCRASLLATTLRGDARWIELRTGAVSIVAGVSGMGSTQANAVPRHALILAAGIIQGGGQVLGALHRITERGVVVRVTARLGGVPTGMSVNATDPSWHGSFRVFPRTYVCQGSNGRTPLIGQAGGDPDLGNGRWALTLTNALPNSSVLWAIGTSSTNWIGVPLPFSLNGFGLPSDCAILVSLDILIPLTTPPSVALTVPFPIACTPNVLGTPVYHQWLTFDLGVPSGLPIRASNAAEVVVR